MLKNLTGGFTAGLLISIGGSVYLSCQNKYVGAVLFSVALLCICMKGYALFTGRVGYMAESHNGSDLAALGLCLLGNAIGTFVFGLLVRVAVPALQVTAFVNCTAKLSQDWYSALIRGVMCGVLMYLAVSIYKEKNMVWSIFFCVPAFILSGFEHSIANMFYFAVAGTELLPTLWYLVIIVGGNSLGGLLLPFIKVIEDRFLSKEGAA